jgi:hypothetical protein
MYYSDRERGYIIKVLPNGASSVFATVFKSGSLALTGNGVYLFAVSENNGQVHRIHTGTAASSVYAGDGVPSTSIDCSNALCSGYSGYATLYWSGHPATDEYVDATSLPLETIRSIDYDDSDGSLYVAETTAGRIRRVFSNGTIATYAGRRVGCIYSAAEKNRSVPRIL